MLQVIDYEIIVNKFNWIKLNLMDIIMRLFVCIDLIILKIVSFLPRMTLSLSLWKYDHSKTSRNGTWFILLSASASTVRSPWFLSVSRIAINLDSAIQNLIVVPHGQEGYVPLGQLPTHVLAEELKTTNKTTRRIIFYMFKSEL